MKPPICAVCGKRLGADEGMLIYFKKRPSDIDWEKRMNKIGGVGHPPYAEWFCKEHFKDALELKDKNIDEAMKILSKSP